MFRHFINVMELFVIEDYRSCFPDLSGSVLTDTLIKEILYQYGYDDRDNKEPAVMRTEKGKPYTDSTKDGRQIYLSVSHTGDYFVCLLGDRPVGVDIQIDKKASTEKLSRRFFTLEEQEYVEEQGIEGFFFIWTRKEAYSKITGLGIEEIMKKNTVLGRTDVEFTDFKLEGDIWCSCCIMIEGE